MCRLTIRDWEKWQSYRKDRGQPPWIKVHRRLLRNPKWVELTDTQRGQLISLWVLAADHDGDIDAPPEMIARLCHLSDPLDLQPFIDRGFIEVDAAMTSTRRQDDVKTTPQNRSETEEKSTDNPPYNPPHENQKQKFGEFVTLTPDEHRRLVERFGEVGTAARIEALDNYIGSKGRRYKSHYHTILSWARNDSRDRQQTSGDDAIKAWMEKHADDPD